MQALSEFVDGSESWPGAVPRNILMVIMQLNDFLEKVTANKGGKVIMLVFEGKDCTFNYCLLVFRNII